MSEDRHARTSGSATELLYDENIPTPTHAERSRYAAAYQYYEKCYLA